MGITIDKDRARERLLEAIAWAQSDRPVPAEWVKRSVLVGEVPAITYTPMLGTGLLARATDGQVDALALKETSGQYAYSARGLCHQVLVPASVEHGFSIRTTGREPLNNQPFFRYDRVDQAERVRTPEHLRYLIECLTDINGLSPEEALGALAAFIRVAFERAEAGKIGSIEGVASGLRAIVNAAKALVSESAEGGRRAQALTSAVFDAVYGPDRVRTRLVNDPSRHFPGDVQALDAGGRAIASAEVRAKPVPETEIEQFARALASDGITRGLVVALADDQPALAYREIAERLATQFGVLVTVIDSVDDLMLAAFAWSTRPLPEVLAEFPRRMMHHLHTIGTDRATLDRWAELVSEITVGGEPDDLQPALFD